MKRIRLAAIAITGLTLVTAVIVIFRNASGNFERDGYQCERDARQSFFNGEDIVTQRAEFQKRCMTARGHSLEDMRKRGYPIMPTRELIVAPPKPGKFDECHGNGSEFLDCYNRVMNKSNP